jgi:hypothetical protein
MRRALVLVALLVMAGCAGGPASPDATATQTPTPTPTWDGDPDNHFRERTLTVALADEAGTGRDYAPLVREALDYWEQNAAQFAGFPIEYEFAPNATDPDVRVRFVAEIEECGSETDEFTAGCAPYLKGSGPVDRPVDVRIETGYDDASTVTLLQHEFGHTLGLDHDDEPAAVMSARANLTTLPQPDATDRALPWARPNLTYYVDYGQVPADERPETREQVEAAFGYVADGADGTVPANVTFTRTSNRSAADVVVRFAESDSCTDGGSCGSLRGFDPDGDGALETYSRLEITVVGVDTEARGWHVGYWTARGFGLRGEELPAPLRTDDPDVRRSEWWR